MAADIVHWNSNAVGCNRCGGTARYYIPPYYMPTRRICPRCVIELNRLFDAHGWPQEGRWDRAADTPS